MLFMHQALPHYHHEHTLIDDINASTHHHSHQHEHEEEHEDSNDFSDILDFLLGSHSHSYHTNDFQVKNDARTHHQVKNVLSFISSEFQILSIEYPPNRVKPFLTFTVVYQHPFLFTPTLRGPPTLG